MGDPVSLVLIFKMPCASVLHVSMLHVTVGKTIVRLVMISFYVLSIPLGHVACWNLPCQGLYLLYTLPVIAKYEPLSVCLLSSKKKYKKFFFF